MTGVQTCALPISGTIIAVTGTNGKTTVSNLLTDILEADGKKVLSNRSGSNITSGISTAADLQMLSELGCVL